MTQARVPHGIYWLSSDVGQNATNHNMELSDNYTLMYKSPSIHTHFHDAWHFNDTMNDL